MPADLSRVYDTFAETLHAFLLGMTRHEADARDVLQAVFLRLAREPETLHGVRDPRAFLLRMAHRQFIDLTRRRAARERCHESFAAETSCIFEPTGDPDADARSAELEEMLATLPEAQRAVVLLRIWEDMTFEEIARALDIPLHTAASRFRYALEKLRQLCRSRLTLLT